VFVEWLAGEAQALRAALAAASGQHGPPARVRIERGDGLALLRAYLPPPERRGLAFIDPPYEAPAADFAAVTAAVADGLRRFPTGVFAAWYPLKERADALAWHARWSVSIAAPTLLSELWLYPPDSRVSLNGSGLLIVNPPWRIMERMSDWLPELQSSLAVGSSGGTDVRMLSQSARP
ncbi:MAG TPA: 23S rRNA (adenine(2030)-N(6))-methyltransferase RlmJ, partial [Steroidobacteraceae bacterium]|nr:23S rRNA (adenine(2030)-N(6))-methyltransferase RlmJ [Steroidobacteraceae bacterium]